ncbi:RNA polymerase sigma factor [Sulfitobacter guttiformis]|uniref:RNA polymerase ECF family sigma subunit n=1 Tax=Sulfitobacter guttiformis TaxID=74349 RepID=A0A420DNM9_9RHOB|nr:RNA polymerase sigma factor [Sulfitobacter guttiformis]KIN73219.1 RNA polymerase sigma-70 factor, ECF family protein [Sulfitobacter guttiformis KCTC 32187]RKE95894.1 RNA polymerase ECF family sigma subunit [Sulfitobacter guttiformis]
MKDTSDHKENGDFDGVRDADAALLARYAAGDGAAARILSARLAPRAYAHAYRVLGDRAEAEDVTQEALLRLWKQAPKWDDGRAQAATWLYRVVANLCMDRLRTQRTQTLDEIDAPVDPAPAIETRLQNAARHDALQAALLRLPERQRQAVILRHIEGLANPDIAEILDVGVEAVESLTARGKRALSADLAAQRDALGYDDDTT